MKRASRRMRRRGRHIDESLRPQLDDPARHPHIGIVDHLAVQRHRALALRLGLLHGLDHPPRLGQFLGRRRERAQRRVDLRLRRQCTKLSTWRVPFLQRRLKANFIRCHRSSSVRNALSVASQRR